MDKLALISDIHGNLEALTAVLHDARDQGVDAYACLGDIVGYGADPVACLELLRSLAPVAVIQGNHDLYAADDRELMRFNTLAAMATDWTRRQLGPDERSWLKALPLQTRLSLAVELVHATPNNPDSWSYVRHAGEGALAMLAQSARLCFYGHTHLPTAFCLRDGAVAQSTAASYDLAEGERWLVNAGSVGQPRDGDWRAAYALYEPSIQRLSMRRVEYDLQACQAKILAAGLPPRLAERLARGQ